MDRTGQTDTERRRRGQQPAEAHVTHMVTRVTEQYLFLKAYYIPTHSTASVFYSIQVSWFWFSCCAEIQTRAIIVMTGSNQGDR